MAKDFMICERCGISKRTFTTFNGESMCIDCANILNNEKIMSAVEAANTPGDYRDFSADDLSDAFWMSLGRYVKHPNKKDLNKMYDMWLWACHDSHAQSRNFSNALKWCKIDLYAERKKDLPEE